MANGNVCNQNATQVCYTRRNTGSSCGRDTDTAESFCQLRYISLSEDKQVSKKTLPLCIKHHDAGKLDNHDF